jgi:phage terminase large subunit GpA-like protein
VLTCPYCDTELGPRALHAHLVDEHGDRVESEPYGDQTAYVVTCPRCGERYRKVMRKSGKVSGFVDEFDHPIRMVAFDMLINHLLAEHESTQPQS